MIVECEHRCRCRALIAIGCKGRCRGTGAFKKEAAGAKLKPLTEPGEVNQARPVAAGLNQLAL